MEHLVVDEVFDSDAGCVGAVEDAADDDGVVCGVVVAQHAACVVSAPGEDRAAEKAVEETRIKRVEDFVEIEAMTLVSENALASASLANVFCLT